MSGWVTAAVAAVAAFIPAGVYFTIYIVGYGSASGVGTGAALDAAPGPLIGAGLIPAAFVIGAAYRLFRRARHKAPSIND